MVWLFLSAMALPTHQDSTVLVLEDAVARALLVSPIVAAAEGAINAPRGERAEAFWPFPTNPSFQYGRIRRRSLASTVFDREWSVSQDIEIASWLFRSQAAGRRVRSAEEQVADQQRRVGLNTRLAYLDLAIAERRAALADSNAIFAGRLAEFASRQLEAGEINRLEHNAAVLEAARTRSTAERAFSDQGASAAELARILALGNDTIPTTAPLPDVPELAVSDDSVIIALARARRADLSAAGFAVDAAERAMTAARLSFLPNLTVSVFGGREEASDDLFGFGVGLTIPLFHRGQSIKGLAEADRAGARAELVAVERAIRAEVLAATQRYARARTAERRFASDVLRAATENVTLTQTALAEGEVSVTDVVVLRTAAVRAQLEYLDVLADATASWFELAAALNASPAELTELLNAGMEQH